MARAGMVVTLSAALVGCAEGPDRSGKETGANRDALAASLASTLAHPEFDLNEPADWAYVEEGDEEAISAKMAEGYRLISLDHLSNFPIVFAATFVHNSGLYARAGNNWAPALTEPELLAMIADPSIRIVDIAPYYMGDEHRYGAVWLSGASPNPDVSYKVLLHETQETFEATAAAGWRVIDVTAEPQVTCVVGACFPIPGQFELSGVLIANNGPDAREQWLGYGSPGDVIVNDDTRIADFDTPFGDGSFYFVAEAVVDPATDRNWWLTDLRVVGEDAPDQTGSLAHEPIRLGGRYGKLKGYAQGSETRYLGVVYANNGCTSLTAPPDVVLARCEAAGNVSIGQPAAIDNCPLSVTGHVTATNGQALATPIPVVNGNVNLGPGVHTVQWVASDGSNNAPVIRSQTVTLTSKIQASFSFLVGNGSTIRGEAGGFAGVVNSGAGETRIGNDARVGGVLSRSAVGVQDRAIVSGNILSAGDIVVSNAATVTGTRTRFGSPFFGSTPALPDFPAPSGSDIIVNSGVTRSLAAGSFPAVSVNSGGILVLGAGDYFFRQLTVNSNATVRVLPNTRIFVRDQLALRSAFTNGGALQSIFLGFQGTSTALEAGFRGTLVAPNATVVFGSGSGLSFFGSFFARTLDVRPQSSLVCE